MKPMVKQRPKSVCIQLLVTHSLVKANRLLSTDFKKTSVGVSRLSIKTPQNSAQIYKHFFLQGGYGLDTFRDWGFVHSGSLLLLLPCSIFLSLQHQPLQGEVELHIRASKPAPPPSQASSMTTTSTRNAAAAASSTLRLDGLEERARPPHQANSGKTNNARIYYTSIEVELKVCPEKKDICLNWQSGSQTLLEASVPLLQKQKRSCRTYNISTICHTYIGSR